MKRRFSHQMQMTRISDQVCFIIRSWSIQNSVQKMKAWHQSKLEEIRPRTSMTQFKTLLHREKWFLQQGTRKNKIWINNNLKHKRKWFKSLWGLLKVTLTDRRWLTALTKGKEKLHWDQRLKEIGQLQIIADSNLGTGSNKITSKSWEKLITKRT